MLILFIKGLFTVTTSKRALLETNASLNVRYPKCVSVTHILSLSLVVIVIHVEMTGCIRYPNRFMGRLFLAGKLGRLKQEVKSTLRGSFSEAKRDRRVITKIIQA